MLCVTAEGDARHPRTAHHDEGLGQEHSTTTAGVCKDQRSKASTGTRAREGR